MKDKDIRFFEDSAGALDIFGWTELGALAPLFLEGEREGWTWLVRSGRSIVAGQSGTLSLPSFWRGSERAGRSERIRDVLFQLKFNVTEI